MEIIRGTTPTIIFTFEQIKPEELAVAYLLIKQGETEVIRKELSEGLISEGSLLFTLSQEETLSLAEESAKICLDWKTTAGVRGRSNIYDCSVRIPGIEGVI